MTAPTIQRGQRSEAARTARQEEILDAARRVFAERGFKGTTIADVAEAAGIALGTIYLYFKSKDEIFAALGQRLHALIAEAFHAGDAEPTLDATVRLRVRNVFEACGANRDLIRLVVLNSDLDGAGTRRMRQAERDRAKPFADGLALAAERGWIRNEDPLVMARLILGLATMAVYQAYVFSDGEGAEQLREACADMITAYLRPTDGSNVPHT